ncbi:DUF6522 family protein [Shinella sp.]|uniref:DUF6522 family protein n=1 Tax=Shinella sp. TaxID=1870904 RepID=UPI0029A0B62E|nr:DUF6522 family protein [Shinella sp.]MDX3978433.1 DUF6522 family protein [Shinella sp.]
MTEIVNNGSLSPEQSSYREFFLNVAFIAKTFDISQVRVRALMTRKLFRSVVEKGVGDDDGLWRLTLRSGNRAWQGIVTSGGDVERQTVVMFRHPRFEERAIADLRAVPEMF